MAEAVKAKRMQEEPNRLIREWLNPKRVATEDEIKKVLEHVAKAPFSTRSIAVDKSIRGLSFQGRKLGDKEPSIIAHLAKRVLVEQQWAERVTPDEFLFDLRSAVTAQDARRAIFVRRDGGYYMGFLSPNSLPAYHLGPAQEAFLWVVYSVDYGTIRSGYQVAGVHKISFQGKVRWL